MSNSLQRFRSAQGCNPGLAEAIKEIQNGKKESHWIWYIFPQLTGLGITTNAKTYGISDFKEACDYLKDPLLFENYFKMVKLVETKLSEGIAIETLMGYSVDALKLASSLTLFSIVASDLQIKQMSVDQDFKQLSDCCNRVLNTIAFQGYPRCEKTQKMLQNRSVPQSAPVPLGTSSGSLFRIEPPRQESRRHEPPRFQPQQLKTRLEHYISERKKEWGFHYNFLGIMSVLYFIQDGLSGTDHFNSKSREVKISAADKLKKILDPSSTELVVLTESEKNALKDGRLGKLVSRAGGLESILKNQSSKSETTELPSQAGRIVPL